MAAEAGLYEHCLQPEATAAIERSDLGPALLITNESIAAEQKLPLLLPLSLLQQALLLDLATTATWYMRAREAAATTAAATKPAGAATAAATEKTKTAVPANNCFSRGGC